MICWIWRGCRVGAPSRGEDNHLRLERLLTNLQTAIGQELTQRQLEMLEMHFFQGMTVTDIANKLGLSKSTVPRTFSRPIDKLFRVLRYSL